MNQTPNYYAPPGELSMQGAGVTAHGTPRAGAGFGIRFGARVVDALAGVLVGGAGGVASVAVVAALGGAEAVSHVATPNLWLSVLIGIPGPLLYHGLSEGLGGATIGKALCGLRTVRADGRACGIGAALLREIAFYVDGFFFGLVAYSFMQKSELRQRIGDRWASTVVVAARDVPPAAARSVALPIVLSMLAWFAYATITSYVTRHG